MLMVGMIETKRMIENTKVIAMKTIQADGGDPGLETLPHPSSNRQRRVSMVLQKLQTS